MSCRRISKIMKLIRVPPRVNASARIPSPIRRIVLRNYDNKCAGSVPGLPCDYNVVDALEIDHILPKSIYCINRLCNLQVLCSNCHTLKTKNYDLPLIHLHKQGYLKRKHVREHLHLFL